MKSFGEMLLAVTARPLGVPPIALGLGGSATGGLRIGSAQDVDVIAVAEGPPPSRMLVTAFGRLLDITVESPQSLASELNEPRRPSLIRLLAGTQILRDRDDLLSSAAERSRGLLAGPPPPSLGPNETTLAYEIRDGSARLSGESGPMRALLRGALLERVVNLMYVRTGCWPGPLRHAVEVLTAHDMKLGARLAKALEDDGELLALANWMLIMPATRSAGGAVIAPVRREAPPAEPIALGTDVWKLPPPALARLPAKAAAALCIGDLRRMSKLQVLTVHRVHGGALGAPEQGYINAMLDDSVEALAG